MFVSIKCRVFCPVSVSHSLEIMENDSTKNCARFKKLGFTPQKEIVYNKVLPYSEELDYESRRLLVEIKGNLAKSVVLKEIKPGCAIWATRLQK